MIFREDAHGALWKTAPIGNAGVCKSLLNGKPFICKQLPALRGELL